jgi:hypothetical protein
MTDVGGYASEGNSPAALRPVANLADFPSPRFSGESTSRTVEVSVRRLPFKAGHEDLLEKTASAASTINITRSSSSVNPTRTNSAASGERVDDFSVARQLRHRLRQLCIAGNTKTTVQRVKSDGSHRTEGSIERQSPARAVLPEWPAIDDDLFAPSKRHLLSFDLDPTTLPSDVLCHLALEMFVSAGLPAGLATPRVRCFILAVRASMLDNPYHNFYHVIDVMQTTNALATCTGTMARLDAWERFALLSAALCHDMEHPGVTSQFLSKAAGDATRGKYKDIIFRDALLEKHHALRALEFMCDRDVGILEGLSSAQYYHFRSSVSKIILATDMTRHNEYVKNLQEFAVRRAEDPAVEIDKQLAMELMVKCADISNVVKPVAVARRWALRITDEFFLQGNAERAMGMDISPTCDRFSISRVELQTGFIDHVAAPLFTLFAAAFPQDGFETPLAQLRHNRALYALCSDLDLEEARDWEETDSSIVPSSSRAEYPQLSSDEEESF